MGKKKPENLFLFQYSKLLKVKHKLKLLVDSLTALLTACVTILLLVLFLFSNNIQHAMIQQVRREDLLIFLFFNILVYLELECSNIRV